MYINNCYINNNNSDKINSCIVIGCLTCEELNVAFTSSIVLTDSELENLNQMTAAAYIFNDFC